MDVIALSSNVKGTTTNTAGNSTNSTGKVRVATSLEQLNDWKLVTLDRRPNPKMRKKLKQKLN